MKSLTLVLLVLFSVQSLAKADCSNSPTLQRLLKSEGFTDGAISDVGKTGRASGSKGSVELRDAGEGRTDVVLTGLKGRFNNLNVVIDQTCSFDSLLYVAEQFKDEAYSVSTDFQGCMEVRVAAEAKSSKKGETVTDVAMRVSTVVFTRNGKDKIYEKGVPSGADEKIYQQLISRCSDPNSLTRFVSHSTRGPKKKKNPHPISNEAPANVNPLAK